MCYSQWDGVYCPFGGWKTSLCFLWSQRRWSLTFMTAVPTVAAEVCESSKSCPPRHKRGGVYRGFYVHGQHKWRCMHTHQNTQGHTHTHNGEGCSHWPVISLLRLKFTSGEKSWSQARHHQGYRAQNQTAAHPLTDIQEHINKYPEPRGSNALNVIFFLAVLTEHILLLNVICSN